MSVRDELIGVIREGNIDFGSEVNDDTSLIRSGLIDSLALFKLALWIEKEVDSKLDITTLDPSNEWDTIADILEFVEKRRV
jgi:acyl carrier protein